MKQRRQARRSPDQWRAIIARQADSGLSARAFCEAEKIGYASFVQWRRRLAEQQPRRKAKQSTPTFIELTSAAPVTTTSSGSESPWLIELDLAPGVQLRIAR